MSEKPRSGTLLRQQMRRERHENTNNNDDNDDDDNETEEAELVVDDVLSMQWRTAVKLVEDGEADGILSELREAEHRSSVLDAIDERDE